MTATRTGKDADRLPVVMRLPHLRDPAAIAQPYQPKLVKAAPKWRPVLRIMVAGFGVILTSWGGWRLARDLDWPFGVSQEWVTVVANTAAEPAGGDRQAASPALSSTAIDAAATPEPNAASKVIQAGYAPVSRRSMAQDHNRERETNADPTLPKIEIRPPRVYLRSIKPADPQYTPDFVPEVLGSEPRPGGRGPTDE